MPSPLEKLQAIRKRFDDAATNYLRQTTTDQELLDFYGEGNIIGRKGIPDTKRGMLDAIDQVRESPDPRPYIKQVRPEVPEYTHKIVDMPGAVSPQTGRPYQLDFQTLPFGGHPTPTAAAQRFLQDFRVPTGQTVDYAFEISPNVEDVKAYQADRILKDVASYKDSKAAQLAIDAGQLPPRSALRPSPLEELREIEARVSGTTRFDGDLATPSVWQSRGFTLPIGLRDTTLTTFKDSILQQETPFGSVSQLNPVVEKRSNLRPGGDPNWRANLYEKEGFAGPLTESSLRLDRGPRESNVQMFTRGKERLLPIQPYTEFLPDQFDASKPSALGTKPAPDFTPFQKGIGTRNYLLGRNILQGRGTPGGIFRGALAGAPLGIATAPLDAFSPEVAYSLGEGDYTKGALQSAGNLVTGAAVGGVLGAIPQVAPLMTHPATALLGGAYALTQIPEAATAYRAGKNKISVEEQKAIDRAEDVKAFKEAFGSTSQRYRR